ncbi:MAG: ABC transporter permease [Candidatus Odinarchaeota archaeon]|nr:ABC transporter permease [Candidatus Odinarchaeota archaeon]
MLFKRLIRMGLKYNRRKTSIGIFVIVTFSAFLLMLVVGNVFVRTSAQEYVKKQLWPTEIYVEPNSIKTLKELQTHLKDIDGVKWFIYPGDGLEFQQIYYNNKSYYIFLMWCNVEDPTFPNPKFLYEGRFFTSNYENAVIIDSATEKLLEYTGRFNGLGESGTKWDILGINMSVIGVISNPALYGNENYTLQGSTVFNIYVPLHTYEMLFNISKQPQYINVTPAGNGIFVKVKEGYSIKEVASRIRNTFPNVYVFTEESYENATYTQVVIPAITNSVIAFSIVGVIMVWEIRHIKEEIILLKAIGWKSNDIVILFLLKDLTLGLVASFSGFVCMLLLYKFVLGFFNAYIAWFIASLIPLTTLFVIVGTIIFSLPSLIAIYRSNVEKLLRA